MIDTHNPRTCDDFDADRDEVLARAAAAGVRRLVVVSEDADDSRRTLEVCARYPDLLRPAVGLHPDRFGDERTPPDEAEIEAVCALAREHAPRLAAIGEVGLDYWAARDHGRRALQREALARFAALAEELDLPLSVHCRSAGRYTLEVLAECGARRVAMHAFDGRASYARRAAEEHGWLFSVPPSVLRSAQKQKLARALPLSALLLESDSPALGPERGERNEPANLRLVLRELAALRRESEDELRQATTDNARRLFGACLEA